MTPVTILDQDLGAGTVVSLTRYKNNNYAIHVRKNGEASSTGHFKVEDVIDWKQALVAEIAHVTNSSVDPSATPKTPEVSTKMQAFVNDVQVKGNDPFKMAMGHSMKVEGLYADDDNDSGGETWKGIARNFHKSWAGWQIIDAQKVKLGLHFTVAALNKALLAEPNLDALVWTFYKIQFWDTWRGDEVAKVSPDLALEMFDTGVNMGTGRAVGFLQRALNVLDRNSMPDLVVDGAIGRKTLQRLSLYDDDWKIITMMLRCQQGTKYIEFMEAKPSQEDYARGWYKRV
jgi:lysozyme family protein